MILAMDQASKRALVDYLAAAMARTGKDASNLARAIGVEPSTLTRPLQPAWTGGLSTTTLRKIADISGLPIPPELSYIRKNSFAGRESARDTRVTTEARAATYVPADRRDLIPVRSAGRGGDEQEMFLSDGPVDYVPRPHVLERVKEAYAIYMVGDSMSPRYEPGFTLYVNPFKPPRPGNGVVVYKTNDSVLVKRFKAITPDELIVEQLNPPQELRIPRTEIAHIHLIVHVDEVS
jgi:phage repressor protein C with HTH and peptisase S24 domain